MPPLSYVPKERMGEGTAVGPTGRRRWKDSDRSTKFPPRRFCERGSITLETFCGAGSTPHAEGSFFLYEKSVLRESDWLRGRRTEVCTDSTTPFSALKKPSKKMGIQGESLPDAPPAAHLRIRRSRIPKCVVKQRTAETRGQSPRGLDLPSAQKLKGGAPEGCNQKGKRFTNPG